MEWPTSISLCCSLRERPHRSIPLPNRFVRSAAGTCCHTETIAVARGAPSASALVAKGLLAMSLWPFKADFPWRAAVGCGTFACASGFYHRLLVAYGADACRRRRSQSISMFI